MIEFRFLAKDFDLLTRHVLRGNTADEEAAFLLASQLNHPELVALIVHEIKPVPDSGLLRKGKAGLAIDPEFIAPLIKQARSTGASLILCHSHPFSDRSVRFSTIDDAGEAELFPKILSRVPNWPVGAMVLGQDSADARIWFPGQHRPLTVHRIRTVGGKLAFTSTTSGRGGATIYDARLFDRQIRAFTPSGQEILGALHVAIVGLGGIGSQILQQLVHLGVHKFTLVDPDVIEPSNASRLVAIAPSDAYNSLPKVDVFAQTYQSLFPQVQMNPVRSNVYYSSAAALLRSVDLIFCCTDTMVSRMVLTRFPMQYYIPLIDLGVNIQVRENQVSRIGGRVMTILPEDPCLDCVEILNHEQLQRELEEFGVVGPSPYVTGLQDAEASVVSYNGVVASLAVNEFLGIVLEGIPELTDRTYCVYDGIKGTVRRVYLERDRDCGICRQVRGMGDSVPLPCLSDR